MIRRWLLARALDRSLKARKVVRKARSEAAHRGVHTEIQRRAAQARAMFTN